MFSRTAIVGGYSSVCDGMSSILVVLIISASRFYLFIYYSALWSLGVISLYPREFTKCGWCRKFKYRSTVCYGMVWSEGLGVWGTCGSRTQTTAYPTSTNPTLPKYEPPGRRNGADEIAEHHMATATDWCTLGRGTGKLEEHWIPVGGTSTCASLIWRRVAAFRHLDTHILGPELESELLLRTVCASCNLLITPRSFAFCLCTDIDTSPIFAGSASQQYSALLFILSFEFYEKLGWACTEILLSGYEKLWCWCKSLLCHCVLEMVPQILNRFLTFIWRSLVFM